MSWTLNLEFLGLIGLAPINQQQWLAVFPDLKRGSDPATDLPEIGSHQALIGIRRENVVSTSPTLKPRLAKGSIDYYELDRHYIRLPGPGRGVTPLPELNLVPNMKDLEPKAQALDQSLLSLWFERLVAPGPKLTATVLLDRGKLNARSRFLDFEGESVPYEFRRETASSEEIVKRIDGLADGFRLATEIENDTATIVLGDSLGNSHPIIVSPEEAKALTITFHNEELERVFDFPSDPVSPKHGDIDFAIFYNLSSGWDELRGKPLAIPFRASGSNRNGGGKNKPCRGAQYVEIAA